MQVYINGEERQLPENISLQSLLKTLEMGDQRFAVEVNQELIPRSVFDRHRLCAGDRVEIVQAIGGG